MRKIYKISIFLGALIIIFTIGNFHFAQGKGYFFEKDNNFYIFDNLVIGNPITGSGYLAVEQSLSAITGLGGDVLVGKNLIMDPSSKVYFCKDLGGSNKDCSKKVMAWTEAGLDVVDNAFYQLQTQTIDAGSSNLNFAANKDISATNAVKLGISSTTLTTPGCFANDGSSTCNDGELKTSKLYLDNIASLNTKTAEIDTITLNPSKLIFTKLDLGVEGDVNLPNGIKIGGDTSKPKIDLQNLCWKAAGNVTDQTSINCPSPATGGWNSDWNFYAGGNTYQGGYYTGGSDAICCNLYINLYQY